MWDFIILLLVSMGFFSLSTTAAVFRAAGRTTCALGGRGYEVTSGGKSENREELPNLFGFAAGTNRGSFLAASMKYLEFQIATFAFIFVNRHNVLVRGSDEILAT
jgi:hypothetical protein